LAIEVQILTYFSTHKQIIPFHHVEISS